MDPPEMTREENNPTKSYALSGKIMLSAIVILFFVVILMVCLHLYARLYLLRARRRQIRRVRNRRTHLVFYMDPANPNSLPLSVPTHGLHSSVLKTLPVFTYSTNTHPDLVDCAVCLSEFEEGETGRVLPKCNHSFHIDCIDMWFHSHSTCPLCRSSVEPVPENPSQEASSSEIASSSLCATCLREDAPTSSSSSTSFGGGGGKAAELVGVRIEVPRRNGILEEEPVTESPGSHSMRSPMSRMLSFKRILSRERRGSLSPSSCAAPPLPEVVIDMGREDVSQELNRS